jgi:hypothetical protein
MRTAAHEGGRESVPEDVCRGVIIQPRLIGGAGDDVVGTPDTQALATLVEEQGGTLSPGPAAALHEPTHQGPVQFRVAILRIRLRAEPARSYCGDRSACTDSPGLLALRQRGRRLRLL